MKNEAKPVKRGQKLETTKLAQTPLTKRALLSKARLGTVKALSLNKPLTKRSLLSRINPLG